MKEKALRYYNQGHNCSQCILKALESQYRIPISKQVFAACQGIHNGFGVDGICSVLIAGVMAFGLFFDDATCKRLRMKLFDQFVERYGCMNCYELKKKGKDCHALVGETAQMIGDLIDQEL